MQETNRTIEIVVSTGTLRRNAEQVAKVLAKHGIGLCIVTKSLRISPALLRDAGLKAFPIYDTDTDNGAVILDSGGYLVCEYGGRETFLKEQAGSRRVSFVALSLGEVADALENGLTPHVYLDIDEGRDGITPAQYPQLATLLRDAGRDSVTVFVNARCDLSAATPQAFFTLLEDGIARLGALGIAVHFVSLGGSVLLGCLDKVAQFKEKTGVQVVLRIGESVVVGTVPGIPTGQDDFALLPGVWVRLPILRQKGPDTYLVVGGYPALEPSGINTPDCAMTRLWSEQAVIVCPERFVHETHVEIPLTYSGVARLKVHRDARIVLAD